MRIGYLRESPGGVPRDQQLAMVRAAGVEPEYVYEEPRRDPKSRKRKTDALPQRDYAIQCLRSEDELVIATATALARSQNEAVDVLRRIAERGATLRILQTDEAFQWHPDAASALQLAFRLEEARQAERARWARLHKRKKAPSKWDQLPEATREKARAMWPDMKFSAPEVAAAVGLHERTLHRHLGSRHLPKHLERRTKRETKRVR